MKILASIALAVVLTVCAPVQLALAADEPSVADASGPAEPGDYDEMPQGIADPNVAIAHWSYSDPVYIWRLTSLPDNGFEPPPTSTGRMRSSKETRARSFLSRHTRRSPTRHWRPCALGPKTSSQTR